VTAANCAAAAAIGLTMRGLAAIRPAGLPRPNRPNAWRTCSPKRMWPSAWPFVRNGGLSPFVLLWPLLTSAPSRRALPRVALCAWMALLPASMLAAGSAPRHLVLGDPVGTGRVRHHPAAPLAVQISPGKNAHCRCTSAASTVGTVPVGFAVRCRLASAPSAFYAIRVPRLASLALRRPGHSQSSRRSGGQEQSRLLLQTPPSPSRRRLATSPLPSARGCP